MIFRKALPDDIAGIVQLIAQAQARLAALGIDQWQDGYPDRAVIARDIVRGEGYLLEDETPQVYAAISFAGELNYDVIYDGAWQTDLPYAVIHRVATSETSRRKGAAAELLRQTFCLCEERGVRYLRIDTHADNAPMRGLLAKLDFSRRGVILLEDGAARLAFDKLL